jgi:hypothetical protein
MKRLMVLCLALSLVFGCAGFLTTAKTAQDFICNPTPEQQQTAAAMLSALNAAQAVGAIFYPPVGIFQASAVLTTIKNGGCFLVAQLEDAFKVVDEANLTVVKAKGLKYGAVTALPQYEPLRRLIK